MDEGSWPEGKAGIANYIDLISHSQLRGDFRDKAWLDLKSEKDLIHVSICRIVDRACAPVDCVLYLDRIDANQIFIKSLTHCKRP